MPAPPDSLAVLRRPGFRLLLVAQGVSVLGDRMVLVALAFAVLEVGGSASEVGVVLAAQVVPLVATVLVGGVVADRLPRRAVMVAADLVRLAAQGAMAALLLAGAAEVWMLAVLAGVTGAGTGFFNPASTALLPDIVPADEIQPANGVRWTIVGLAEIAGPALAGVLVAASGAGTAIAVDAATFAISAACLARLVVPPFAAGPSRSFLADLRAGWEAVRSRRWLWTFLAYFAVANVLWTAWQALGPIVADRELGGPAAWGTILAFSGVGGLIGSAVATRLRPARPLVAVALAEGLLTLPLLGLALAVPAAALCVASLANGAAVMFGMTVWETTLQREVPREQLSRVSSYDWFMSLAFMPLGLALWGPVAEGVGVREALWIAFGLMAAAVAALLALPDVRGLRREAGRERDLVADDAV